MKDRKGFTLVELLAVIVILGILLTASVAAVSYLVSRGKVESMDTQRRNLVMAAKSYAQNNPSSLPVDIGENRDISARTVKDAKYLKDNIIDSDRNSCMEKSFVRIHKYDKAGYTYVAYIACGDEEINFDDIKRPKVDSINFTERDDKYLADVSISDGHEEGDIIGLASYYYAIVAVYKENEADPGTRLEVYRSESFKVENGLESVDFSIDLTKYVGENITTFDVIVQAYNLAGGSSKEDFSSCSTLSLSTNFLSIEVGDMTTITVGECYASVSWVTSDSSVATVSNGVITGVGEGNAIITASIPGGVSKNITVEVTRPCVASLSLDKNSVSMVEGTTSTVVATTGCGGAVTWTTSDSSVATVSDGIITGVNPGTATITATGDGKTETVSVVVTRSCTASLSLDKTSVTVSVGGTTTVVATTGCGGAVTWTTSDSSVATVSDGVITGVSNGSATITATGDGKTETVSVTICTPSITVSPTSISIDNGDSSQITAITSCTSSSVTWTSANTSIAKVSSTGKITGTGTNSKVYATTTVTAKVDGVSARVSVRVNMKWYVIGFMLPKDKKHFG